MQLGLLGLIIGTRQDMKWYRLLAGGYAISRASLSCSHGVVAWTIPRARGLCLANALSGLALSVAPAVLAWQATNCEAYTLHVAIMAVVTVGKCAVTVDAVVGAAHTPGCLLWQQQQQQQDLSVIPLLPLHFGIKQDVTASAAAAAAVHSSTAADLQQCGTKLHPCACVMHALYR